MSLKKVIKKITVSTHLGRRKRETNYYYYKVGGYSSHSSYYSCSYRYDILTVATVMGWVQYHIQYSIRLFVALNRDLIEYNYKLVTRSCGFSLVFMFFPHPLLSTRATITTLS